MPQMIITLIYVALALNIIGFLVYAFSTKRKYKKVVPKKSVEVIQPEKNEEELKEEKTEEIKMEVEKEEVKPIVEEINENEKEEIDSKALNLIEELKRIHEEKMSEKEEVIEEKPTKEFEDLFLKEVEEHNNKMDEIDEPFELLEQLIKETPQREEEVEIEDKTVQELVVGNTPIVEKKEKKKLENIVPPKREMVDSINILEIEGEEEPEDLYDEINIKYYEQVGS